MSDVALHVNSGGAADDWPGSRSNNRTFPETARWRRRARHGTRMRQGPKLFMLLVYWGRCPVSGEPHSPSRSAMRFVPIWDAGRLQTDSTIG